MPPRGFNPEMLRAKYTGKRFGSWIAGDQFFRENKHWHVNVTCDCGKKHNVTISSLGLHKGCSCAYLEKVQNYKYRGCKRTELEMIWPDVVKAGREVMEKYYAVASI